MGRAVASTTIPLSFCLNRFPLRRLWVRPGTDSRAISASVESSCQKSSSQGISEKQVVVLSRRIMVAPVDSTREAKAALQWAFSHAVQSQDTIVLVDVIKSTNSIKHGDGSAKEKNPRSYALLYAMKKLCQARRPEVEVEVCLVEGKERGPAIVEEAKRQGVSLLVLGQKKRTMMWRLLMLWGGHRRRNNGGVVEYCIKNASCMTLAVRRKSTRGGGGYLITSRRHKDFWLLA